MKEFRWLSVLVVLATPLAAAEDGRPREEIFLASLPPPPAWSQLSAAYIHKSNSPYVNESALPYPDHYLSRISFKNNFGQTVTGMFMRPGGSRAYPCVLLLHGQGESKNEIIQRIGPLLAQRGIASLALDAWRCGDRAGQQRPAHSAGLRVGLVTRITVLDYRIALDYLERRRDVNAEQIGVLGYSMGAQIAPVLAAVDNRLRAVALCVGCDPVRSQRSSVSPDVRDQLELVSPSNYIGFIAPRPVLMIQGKDDIVHNTFAGLLHDSARRPKEVWWAESGHSLPASTLGQAANWLKKALIKPDRTVSLPE